MMTEPSRQATVSAQAGMDRRIEGHASNWRRWRTPLLLLACAIGAALLIRLLPARVLAYCTIENDDASRRIVSKVSLLRLG